MFKKLIAFTLILFTVQCTLPEINDILPPAVTLIYPYEGAVISTNVDVLIFALDDNEVQRVWYYLNGTEMASTTSQPYTLPLDISGLEKKVIHVIQAAAEDKDGNIGFSALVNFTVAETPDIIDPVVFIVNPQGGQVVEGVVDIVAHAEDDRSIQKVAFFINGDSVGLSTSYPYVYQWDTSTYSDSTVHTIFAKAWDGGNNRAISPVITVTVYPRTGEAGDFTPPTAVFLYPIAGSTVAGIVTVALDIADNVGVAKIELYIDGVLETSTVDPASPWSYEWDSSPKADSLQHTLYVKVYDGAGNVGTATQLVTVFAELGKEPDVTPPTAVFLYPIAGSTITGTIGVSVDLSDNIGVTLAEFYVDGVLERSTNNPAIPWRFNWNTSSKADGNAHTLYVKAYDAAGNVGTSGLLTITIN